MDKGPLPLSLLPYPLPLIMLRIGPAGWDYQDWQGVVYPPGMKGVDRLTFLASWFQAVEINVTFYRPLTPQQSYRWLDAVAAFPDFRFTAKLLNVFTHQGLLPEREVAEFRAGLLPLLAAGRLGVLLAQFPYSFHNTAENRAYLVNLKRHFSEFPMAVEVRHGSWQHREVQDFLTEVGLDFCNIDQPQVSYSLGRTAWVTGLRGYFRAHGRRREKWFGSGDVRDARYDYLYAPEELQDLAAQVRELTSRAPEVYVIFNNHPRGQAVANALEMTHILTGRSFSLPFGLIAAFPRLAEIIQGPSNSPSPGGRGLGEGE